MLELALGGVAAGMGANILRTPMERVKTLMQVDSGVGGARGVGLAAPTLRGTAANIVRHTGWRGLFVGWNMTMARECIQYATYFPAYHTIIRALAPGHDAAPPRWVVALAGASAGAIQWLPPSFCIDTVKSNFQAAPPGTYRNFWDCARQLYLAKGPSVFFRGLGPTLLRSLPLHGTLFIVYDALMRAFVPASAVS